MKWALICLSICIVSRGYAQKPVLDTTVLRNWPRVAGGRLSADGRYALYLTHELYPEGQTGSRLTLLSTDMQWKLQLDHVRGVSEFSKDAKAVLFAGAGDSVGLVYPGRSKIDYFAHVRSYAMPANRPDKWLALLTSDKGRMIGKLLDLRSGKERLFQGAVNFRFNDEGSTFIITTRDSSSGGQSCIWLDLTTGSTRTFWSGDEIDQITFDRAGERLAFIGRVQRDNEGRRLYYFDRNMTVAKVLWKTGDEQSDTTLALDFISGFDDSGRSLYFAWQKKTPPRRVSPGLAKVDVWSYKDALLQPQQLDMADQKKSYKAVCKLATGKVLLIGNELDILSGYTEESALITHLGTGEWGERNWNPLAKPAYYIFSLTTGERKLLTSFAPQASPTGRYVMWYDSSQKSYFIYSVRAKITHDLTGHIDTDWHGSSTDYSPTTPPSINNIVAWLPQDSLVLLQDGYDIWQIDPEGRRPTVNITGGTGKQKKIIFNLWAGRQNLSVREGRILLTAFDTETKENGFYFATVGRRGSLQKLTMGPYLYFLHLPETTDGEPPVASADGKTFLVKRMTAESSPNYFITGDFQTFTPLSDVHPEKAWNWITAELLSWNSSSGQSYQGILYKPENFDPGKKYPVIFYYYEKLSSRLHEFIPPAPAIGPMNIPWFVSRGYLVFTPDIYYTMGSPGESALRSVESAAQMVSRLPFVDATHLGIQGHSWGGFETNYIVTHSNSFAAACSASGVVNFISSYGALNGRSAHFSSRQGIYELGQSRMGKSLWESREMYIANTAVLAADKVTTPILLMHNKEDDGPPFSGAVEFFTGLRRLAKPCWLLQYDHEGHVLLDHTNQIDYTMRMTQFFDHYLRSCAAPYWMTVGIPVEKRGSDGGFSLDPGLEP